MASAAYDIVKERLDGGEVVFLDGAISTEIEKRGVPMDQLVWSGLGSKIGSETLLEVHKDYIRAGADVITTNTFSSARHSLSAAGQGDATREINAMAVSLAKQAVDEASEGRDRIGGRVDISVRGLHRDSGARDAADRHNTR